MTDWQRLEQVIKWTGLSTNAFATGIGLKRSENLYQIKRGNNRISKNLAELIVRKYGSVNPAWLLTGDGEMLVGSGGGGGGGNGANGTNGTGGLGLYGQRPGDDRGGIPYYNMDVLRFVSERYGSGIGGDGGRSRSADDFIRMPGFDDCDFAAVVTGDAMAPEVPSGAVVAVKEVDPAGPVLPDEIYVAVTAEFALMRYVRLDGGGGGLRLDLPVSGGAGVGSVEVRRDRIVRLYLVKGIVIHKVL